MVSAVIFVATSCVSPLTGFAFWETNLAYEGESIYNYLQVKNLSDRTICPPTCCSACSPSR